MKQVTSFQTRDAALHDSQEAAQKHANRLHCKKLFGLAASLTNIRAHANPFGEIVEFIHENLNEFAELDELTKDLELENSEDNIW